MEKYECEICGNDKFIVVENEMNNMKIINLCCSKSKQNKCCGGKIIYIEKEWIFKNK